MGVPLLGEGIHGYGVGFEEEDDGFTSGHFEHTTSLSHSCPLSLPLVVLLAFPPENTGQSVPFSSSKFSLALGNCRVV